MFLTKIKKLLSVNFANHANLLRIIILCLFVICLVLPAFFNNFQMQFFGIPLPYLFVILVAPALILFITNSAIKIFDKIDRQNLETEND